MPAISASAPGKAILFGEHAVVYGQPAIAVPVKQVKATAIIRPLIRERSGFVRIQAEQINLDSALSDLPEQNPIALAVRSTLSELNINQPPAFHLRISSTIPLGGGLGSGAAISVAVIRAVSSFLGSSLEAEQVSDLTFEVEKLYHGNPSGLDNTVVAFEKPIYFVKGDPIEFAHLKESFTLVIADTGKSTPTRDTVAAVRSAWKADKQNFDRLFTEIGELSHRARKILEGGNPVDLGPLMDENHSRLQEMGVSSAELDQLVMAAKQEGALGAKLSGGGRGGNIIALVRDEDGERIEATLKNAGAKGTVVTRVQ
ncbi:MAG: mevalonate kinase [Anaerolineales bacterium]